MKNNEMTKKLLNLILKYKYILLVAAVGALLLLIPTSGTAGNQAQAPPEGEEDFSVSALEERMEQVLSQIDGAGEVRVVLTVKGGMRRILAEDGSNTRRESEHTENWSTVVVGTGSGTQEAVLLQQLYPQFQGAVVVCPGGGDATVRLKLMEAVAALTGLGADKISICKGK